MRAVLVRTLAFFLLIGVPTIAFDVVYWDAPLPRALWSPFMVALRLTATALVAAVIERRWRKPWMPLLVLVASAVIYALGYVQTEYVNARFAPSSASGLHAGLSGLLELAKRAPERPRYFALLFLIVSIPFAVSSAARLRANTAKVATSITAFATFFLVVLLLEPFRAEVGRPLAAFVCLRTIFCGLLLPAVAHISDRYELKQDPE